MPTIALDDIQYDPDIYPREKWKTSTIDTYVDVIKSGQQFPPLILEKDTNILFDGIHRWKAYLKYQELYQEHLKEEEQREQDKAEGKAVVETPDFWAIPPEKIEVEYHELPEELLNALDGQDEKRREEMLRNLKRLYAMRLSARHGDRVTPAERRNNARSLYDVYPDFTLEVLAKYASISLGSAHGYVSDILARRKEEQRMTAFRLQLLGWTKREIAKKLKVSPSTAHEFCSEFSDLKKSNKKLLTEGHPHLDVAERCNMPLILVWAIDLEDRKDSVRLERLNISIQPYDVWNFGKCHELFGIQYPGRIPGQLIAHVLYFFTEPGDMVIDPMCGSGTTQDVCLAMGRKCYGYDLDLRHERPDVIYHNMWQRSLDDNGEPENDHDGNPLFYVECPSRIKKANLIFWDPPYFQKMDKSNIGKDGYIEGSISNLTREEYLNFFGKALWEMSNQVKSGTKLAFIMSDWDDNTEQQEGIFLWDYADLIQDSDSWKLIRHIQIPLSTQQVHPDIVTKFRKQRRLARLERYLLIAEKRV